jgi:hypothetical protein
MPQNSARPFRSNTPQQYEFVSGFDKSYPAHIRAHVLQRHMRERRNNPARLNRLNTRGFCHSLPERAEKHKFEKEATEYFCALRRDNLLTISNH